MSEESSNFMVRLYKGDVPLVITFWVFYIVLGTVLSFIPLVGIIFTVFFSIATLNSAAKYDGLALWRILAQIMAALTLIGIAVYITFLVLGVTPV